MHSSYTLLTLVSATIANLQLWPVLGELLFLGTKEVSVGNQVFENDYYLGASSAIWSSALQDCQLNMGPEAHLLSLESRDESDALLIWLQTAGATFGSYWTSGQFDTNQDVWRWGANPNDSFDSYTNWAANEPSSTAPYKRVAFNFQNQFSSNWAVRDDTFLTRYICEAPHSTTNPTDATSTTQSTTAATIPTTTLTTTPTTTPTTTQSSTTELDWMPAFCSNPSSLTIVLDSSVNMGPEFMTATLLNRILLWAVLQETMGSKLGFVTFSKGIYNIVKFGEINSSNQLEINLKINATEFQTDSQRMTHLAMNHTKLIQQTLSNGLPMSMVVFTNGISDFPAQTREVAAAANAAGITTYAFGIDPADDNDLLNIANGDSNRVFKATWMSALLTLKPLAAAICPENKY